MVEENIEVGEILHKSLEFRLVSQVSTLENVQNGRGSLQTMVGEARIPARIDPIANFHTMGDELCR